MAHGEPAYGLSTGWARLLSHGLFAGAVAGVAFGVLYFSVCAMAYGPEGLPGALLGGFLYGSMLGLAAAFCPAVRDTYEMTCTLRLMTALSACPDLNDAKIE